MGIWIAIKEFLMLPVTITAGIWNFLAEIFLDARRGRVAVYAFPAIILGTLGLLFLLFILLGRTERNLQRYLNGAENTRRAADELLEEIKNSLARSLNRPVNNFEIPKLMAEDNEQYVQFRELRLKQQMYLEKLIEISPEATKHKFEYAKSFEAIDPVRYHEQLSKLAPDDEPGYAPAHESRALLYASTQPETPSQLGQLRAGALKHAEMCLSLDPTNLECRKIKANLLYSLGQFGDAVKIFRELIEHDPEFVFRVIDLNRRLGKDADNASLIGQVASKLEIVLQRERDNSETWTKTWEIYTKLMINKRDFDLLKQTLDRDLRYFSDDPARVAMLNQHLTDYYVERARYEMFHPTQPPNFENILSWLAEALKLSPRNPDSLILLTEIYLRKDQWRERAKSIYDPTEDQRAPWNVYYALAREMYIQQNFTSAIEYYERARRVDPNRPEVLNNLAYCYLVSGLDTPAKALSMVDQALRIAVNVNNDKRVLSTFFHTRAVALSRMNRHEEAAASFEQALEGRPDDQQILLSIIESYSHVNPKQAEIYQRKLDLLRARSNPKSEN